MNFRLHDRESSWGYSALTPHLRKLQLLPLSDVCRTGLDTEPYLILIFIGLHLGSRMLA